MLARLTSCMELAQRPHPTEVTLKISFDEATGVLKVGYSTTINLASALGYRLTRDEAKALASALEAYASRA
jgi:hypothetical protein